MRPVLVSFAVPRYGADAATRLAGKADERAQLHQRLVRLSGILAVEQLVGDVLNIHLSVIGKTRDDPANVAVDDGMRRVEGDAGYRRGGVVADARQGANARVFGRKCPEGGNLR